MRIFLAILSAVVLAVAILVWYTWRHPMAIFNGLNRRALKSAGFTESSVKSAEGKQAVWEAGSGPVLIFLHGAGDQAGTWSKVVPEFTSSYNVIVPDLAGHGDSEPRTGTIHIPMLVKGLEAVIQKKADAGQVTIVGNSLGAWVAMLYAQQHPDRVARVVLVDGGPITGERPDLSMMPSNREEARKLFDNLMDPGSPKPPGFVLDDIVRQAHNGPIARMAASVKEWPTYLMDGKLAQITTPVDLLWGEADRLFPLTYAQRMETQLPAVRLTTIARCGHVPQQECPKTFSTKLKELLEQPAPSSTIKTPAESQPVGAGKS